MIDVVIVRALHIFAGIIWVGFGLFAGMLGLAAQKMGQQAGTVFKILFVHTPFLRVLPAAAITTTAAGVYLYLRVFNGGQHIAMSQTGSIVLSIGALFGLLAFGHGITISRRLGVQYAQLAVKDDANPEELQALATRIGLHGRISGILMIIAVLGMVLPRYLP